MGTLTGILHATSRALLADQNALNTTAENIGNQNTDGYTRRTVTFTDDDVVTLGTQGTNGVSSNVTATSTAVRDRILLKSVQQATEASSASTARSTALDNLQSLFSVGTSGTDASGIGAAIASFFSGLSALSASPFDANAQAASYAAVKTLAAAFNQTAGRIAAQTSTLNQDITTTVGQVNSLATQVGALNAQISTAPTGDGLETLIDTRDQLVTQIASLIGVNSVTGSNNTIGLSLTDGTPLVSGSETLPLTTGVVSGKAQIYAAASIGGANLTSILQGGTIGGDLQARDQTLTSVSSQLDTLANAIATAVNTQNSSGVTPNGYVGFTIFTGNTAATLTVSAGSGGDFAPSSTSGANGSNATAIQNLQNQPLVGGKTFAESFASLLSGLGQAASDASTASTANAAVLTQNSTQQDALSGVSLDTEAANLTQYQRSYSAAAKVISIINDLLAQAINLGTPTTVS